MKILSNWKLCFLLFSISSTSSLIAQGTQCTTPCSSTDHVEIIVGDPIVNECYQIDLPVFFTHDLPSSHTYTSLCDLLFQGEIISSDFVDIVGLNINDFGSSPSTTFTKTTFEIEKDFDGGLVNYNFTDPNSDPLSPSFTLVIEGEPGAIFSLEFNEINFYPLLCGGVRECKLKSPRLVNANS